MTRFLGRLISLRHNWFMVAERTDLLTDGRMIEDSVGFSLLLRFRKVIGLGIIRP